MADETPSGGSLLQLTAALKNERIRRGLSVEDISRLVNIGASHIQKLECGDFSYLPPLYVFSYLRKYAVEIGIGDESLLESCRQELQLPQAGRLDVAPAPVASGPRAGRRIPVLRILLALAAIVALLLSILYFGHLL